MYSRISYPLLYTKKIHPRCPQYFPRRVTRLLSCLPPHYGRRHLEAAAPPLSSKMYYSASRKPLPPLRELELRLSRYATRLFQAPWIQLPPRITRYSPVRGPVGLRLGLLS